MLKISFTNMSLICGDYSWDGDRGGDDGCGLEIVVPWMVGTMDVGWR